MTKGNAVMAATQGVSVYSPFFMKAPKGYGMTASAWNTAQEVIWVQVANASLNEDQSTWEQIARALGLP